MTSVFLFMALRLNRNVSLRRASLEYFQAESYMESYIDYVKDLDLIELNQLKSMGIDHDGMSGTVTNEVGQLTGVLDHDQSLTLPISEELIVHWNQCVQNIVKENGEIVSAPAFESTSTDGCSEDPPEKYDQTGIINENGSFTLTSTAEPTRYKITSADPPFESNQWTLYLELKLDTGRVIRLEETWYRES